MLCFMRDEDKFKRETYRKRRRIVEKQREFSLAIETGAKAILQNRIINRLMGNHGDEYLAASFSVFGRSNTRESQSVLRESPILGLTLRAK